jgi:hypothetical protein
LSYNNLDQSGMFRQMAQGYSWVTDEPEIGKRVQFCFELMLCRSLLWQFPPVFDRSKR